MTNFKSLIIPRQFEKTDTVDRSYMHCKKKRSYMHVW